MADLIPNFRESLVLEACRVEGEGNKAGVVVDAYDILAFDCEGGRPIPMTLLGLPLPVNGSTYVIFNRVDKSRTLVDGSARFYEFKDLARLLHARAEESARWAASGGVEGPGKPYGDGVEAAEGDAAGSGLPEPEKRGLAGGVISPARWK